MFVGVWRIRKGDTALLGRPRASFILILILVFAKWEMKRKFGRFRTTIVLGRLAFATAL